MRARALVGAVVLSTLAVGTAYCGGDAFTAGPDDDGGAPATNDSGSDASISSDGSSPTDAKHDGHHDGAGNDGSSGDDASIDAPIDAPSDAPVEAGPFSCLSQPSSVLFCDDFDDSATPGARWTLPVLFGSASNAFDTTTWITAPNAYASTTNAIGTDAGAAGASLQKNVTITGTTAELAFNMKVKKLDSNGTVSMIVARLRLENELILDLVLSDTGLALTQTMHLSDGGEATKSDGVRTPQPAGWTHVRLMLNKTSPASVKVTFEDGTSVSVPSIVTAPVTTAVEADVGIITVVPPSDENMIDFDDVLVRGP